MHLVWLRNDLRLADNPALFYAAQSARRDHKPLHVLFCTVPDQWQLQGDAPAKLGMQQQALNDLQPRLNALGIPLVILQGSNFNGCASLLLRYAQTNGATDLWYNREIPFFEQQRDNLVETEMAAAGLTTHRFEADLLLPPDLMKNQQGGWYKVFTPWYRRWTQYLDQVRDLLPVPEAIGEPVAHHSEVNLPGAVQHRQDLWPATEASAQVALMGFCAERLQQYSERRDIPSINGTSTVSPYLASGLISARQCLQAVQEHSDQWRSDPWLREVAWREFYRYLMVGFPSLSRNQPFKPETRALQWEHNPALVSAWQEGRTGFPIVDAAMRQLLQTGWMHNRLRMITASFYTKLMLEHWQSGEHYFMTRLVDGDFPSNNGGWQWCASSGCDASPWFRVFNPVKQSEKFDPEGRFIRRFVPELASVEGKAIHDPAAALREHLGYPAPVIDYRAARERVLERFRALQEMAAAESGRRP